MGYHAWERGKGEASVFKLNNYPTLAQLFFNTVLGSQKMESNNNWYTLYPILPPTPSNNWHASFVPGASRTTSFQIRDTPNALPNA